MTEPDAQDLLLAELRARRDHLPDSFDKAVWHLACGEPDEGLDAIRRSLAAMTEPRQPWQRLTEVAVVAGDWELAAAEARSFVRQFSDRYVPGDREYHAAMLALIAGDQADAAARARDLKGFIGTHQKFRSGQPAGAADIAIGLFAHDAEQVAGGLETLLAWHVRRARARSEVFNSARGVVCLDAVVALLLAHRLGLSVPVATTYRRASLPLLAIHLVEWRGDPLARGLPLTIEADLVAGPWLRAQGIDIPDVPPRPPAAASRGNGRRLAPAEIDAVTVREHLRGREQAKEGSPWQLASWALILGDPDGGRRHLQSEAQRAPRPWPAHPNHNDLRRHFGLALVLGDDEALRETSRLLQAWAADVEAAARRRGPGSMPRPHTFADGYLDFLCGLLYPAAHRPTRAEAEEVGALLPDIPVACIGLVERDETLFDRGLNGVLAEHVQRLERRGSLTTPVCEPAAHLAIAARHLGVRSAPDERYRSYAVPILVDEPIGGKGRLGRLPCDLLGTELWA